MIFGNMKRSKIPLGPPLTKGEDDLFACEVSNLMPPFRKGGFGGISFTGIDSLLKVGQTLARKVGICQVKALNGKSLKSPIIEIRSRRSEISFTLTSDV